VKVIGLLQEVSQYVKANEPGTLKYGITKTLRPNKDGTEDIVMLERHDIIHSRKSLQHYADEASRYKDQQSLKTHGTSEKFTAFQKKLAAQDLIRAPSILKMVSGKGGFNSRL
jgi:quinol monooxygenase YgiN